MGLVGGRQRIVHLGVGNFHRAHMAWYTARANAASGQDWKITGVSLRRSALRDALSPQGFAYTLEIQDGVLPRYERLEALEKVLVAPHDLPTILEALADSDCSIISLTVTEKAYCLRPSDRRLDLHHPEIRSDLDGQIPRTVLGVLAAGLDLRMRRGIPAPTVMCCDNLPCNGRVLRQALLDYLSARPSALNAYVAEKTSFPCSLVDRIVPATTDELRDRVKAATGFADAWPVSCEDFSQWVVEDRFAGPRPAWETAGVEFVKDTAPYEKRKLRMLNGAHSCLAYFGLLAGKTYVHEAVADPRLLDKARAVMTEASETLEGPVRETAPDYARALEKRFANTGLRHELRQIAMDGSQKLPVRILPPLQERLARGIPSPGLEGVLAAWAAFAVSELEAGRVLRDPAHERLKNACARSTSPAAMLAEILKGPDVFGGFFADQPGAYSRTLQMSRGLF